MNKEYKMLDVVVEAREFYGSKNLLHHLLREDEWLKLSRNFPETWKELYEIHRRTINENSDGILWPILRLTAGFECRPYTILTKVLDYLRDLQSEKSDYEAIITTLFYHLLFLGKVDPHLLNEALTSRKPLVEFITGSESNSVLKELAAIEDLHGFRLFDPESHPFFGLLSLLDDIKSPEVVRILRNAILALPYGAKALEDADAAVGLSIATKHPRETLLADYQELRNLLQMAGGFSELMAWLDDEIRKLQDISNEGQS